MHRFRPSIILLACLLGTACCPLNTSRTNPREQILGDVVFVSTSGETVKAIYYANSTVELALPDGTKKTLKQAMSGSGTRYIQEGYQWWEHQGVGTYSVNEQSVFTGTAKH